MAKTAAPTRSKARKTRPAKPRPQLAPAPTPDLAAGPTPEASFDELKVTAHMMTLDAGMFCIVNEGAPVPGQGGLPGVRVSPPPQAPETVEVIGFRPDGWLAGNGDAALVRIARGPAQVMITVYQQAGQPDSAPRLQVLRLAAGVPVVPEQAQAPAPVPAPAAPDIMDVLAHIQGRGDVGARFGEWLGEPGSQAWIEGVAVSAPAGIDPADLSYQAVLGRGWLSPWVEAGEYCGSRGMALPLLGLRVRLTGAAASAYDIVCEASFIDGSTAGPVGNDETCEADSLAALEAVRLRLVPRGKAKPASRGRR